MKSNDNQFNVGDLFICQAKGRGILIEIKDVEPNTPYEKFITQSQPHRSVVIHWIYANTLRTFEVGYDLLELNGNINQGYWKHFPVKQ
jgi:hypothetical protein